MRARVCIHIPIDSSGASHRQMREAGCEVVLGDASWRIGIDRDTLLELSRGAHALMGATIKQTPVDAEFFEQLTDLRIISKYTIGVEDVDLDALCGALEKGRIASAALRGQVPEHVCNVDAIPGWLTRFGEQPLI